jgi:interferon gamma-inducible protein 30
MADSRGIIILSFLCLIFGGSAASYDNRTNNKVSLGVYYESLCPYSANFIINYLNKLFDDDLISAVDIQLVPWGNTRIGANHTFNCQHGPYECLLDTVEACAIDVWPKLEEHFAFINCVETLAYDRRYTQWEACFEKLGLDSNPIYDCLNSGHGTQLELKYAAETNELQPPHKYVPWIVVDGQPLYEDYENFISYICKAYKGAATPTACGKLSQVNTGSKKEKHQLPVSYRDDNWMPMILAHIRSAVTLCINWLNAVGMI